VPRGLVGRVTTMRWVRSRMWLGSWSALFALTIQLVLSFGHVHSGRISGPSVSPRAVSAGTVLAPHALRWAMQPSANLRDAPAVPARRKPANLADDFCAICSVMRLAGVPAPAPVLPLPAGGSRIFFEDGVVLAWAALPHRFFQARAPPEA
jgi:hypothetical protein